MADKKRELGNISHPWNEEAAPSTGIRCPKCGNDGMDGSITGRGGQWGIQRKCLKKDPETGKICGQTWSGGIGVQRADLSSAPLYPGKESPPDDDLPTSQYTGASFRDPSKNFDVGDD